MGHGRLAGKNVASLYAAATLMLKRSWIHYDEQHPVAPYELRVRAYELTALSSHLTNSHTLRFLFYIGQADVIMRRSFATVLVLKYSIKFLDKGSV